MNKREIRPGNDEALGAPYIFVHHLRYFWGYGVSIVECRESLTLVLR